MKKILFATSEALPFASSGGLADVAGSLPNVIADEGCDVRVVMPLYSKMNNEYRQAAEYLGYIYVTLGWRRQYCGVFRLERNGVVYYFLDNEYYFKRNMLYGEYDDAERFAFFSKAVLDILPFIDFMPDILHCNDWQTALSVVYLKKQYGLLEGYADIKAVFTVHNIQYQGRYGKDLLTDLFGLDQKEMPTLEYDGDINLLKGAVVCADAVTTVSPTYAKEIMSPEFSHGLYHVLEQHKGKLSGILNGIDYNYYDPAHDGELFANYTWRSVGRKAQNKHELQKMLGLPESDRPMIAVISRLVDHKGLDLVTLAADDIMADDVQLVVLGTGDPYFENFFTSLARRYPDKVRCLLKYDKELSKKIYAASDIFLMPSRSEPCGLSQMIASRYGSVPVIHETGGLYDSIRDIGWQGGGNGFTFAPYNAWDMLCALRRAETLYNDAEQWHDLVQKVMRVDFTWSKSAKQYIALYDSMRG